ncbi:hypothetical protein C5610_07750 [Idiomarina sp. OT37-5b]|jgi:small-conductance mechanosensitive channel|uniref:Mechanosensitive ion channel MscS domain-containing protein n=1 Tax=Idiomarina aquatica TaxID=1327752 RepID=A0AA94JD17_9GAMM|nr:MULTISPECIES: mechanosensitive ion channel family protein [Idiomarina]AVJ56215.1 hypothetical protein C5610_07750 [Idiomarina sp. OT37-5b]RUO43268.1 hypothetical protein CWE23_07900 [Idiomarina aquatica]
MNLQQLLNGFVEQLQASDSLLRLTISTIVLVTIVFFARWVLRRYIRRNINSSDLRRRWLVQLRNGLLLVLLFGLFMIWGNELRTFALSLVAIAVALVIATKELIICISGTLIKSGAHAFHLGDRIQIKDYRGDVIDQNLLTTTILEVGPGKNMQQRSGRMVVLPNSLFATEPVINESYSKDYVLHTFTVPFKRTDNWRLAQQELLRVAQEYCRDYMAEVKRHFDRMSYRTGLESPSVEPRVTLQVEDPEDITLVVRIPTRTEGRNWLEQTILSDVFSANDFSRKPDA